MNDLLIVKFGGSILKDGRDYIRAASIIKDLRDRGYKVVVVVSAMKGITDLLSKFNELSIEELVKGVYSKYFNALSTITRTSNIAWGFFARSLTSLSNELAKTLWAIRVLGEVTPRVKDYILSFGERFSIILMTAALNTLGLKAKWFTGREAGLVTDSTFGDARPIHEISCRLVRETLIPVLEDGIVPVVAGFIAGTVEGTITIMGRGGSDYTATLLAKYLNAKEVRLYTDVPGIMTADPNKIENARVIPLMSYDEAIELAYLGAKRFHPRTFEPVRDTEIVVRVLPVDGNKGTLIDRRGGGPPLKAVATLENLSIVSVIGTGMVGKLGAAAEIMSAFAKSGVNIIGILQPVSETCISLIIGSNDVPKVLPRLKKISEKGLIRDISIIEPVAAVSIVGQGVRDINILGHIVTKALTWPVKIVSWTSTTTSITFVIPQDKAWDFVRKIHEEVILKWWTR